MKVISPAYVVSYFECGPKTNRKTKNHFYKDTTTKIITFIPDLKQVTTILLTLLIFLQPYSKLWIVVSFKINQNSIAKTLCVKKQIKNNACKGKCHLKKQLDKANEEEQKQAPTNTKEEVLYCLNQISFDFLKQTIFIESKSLGKYKPNFYSSLFISNIYQPPNLNFI